ncbi:flavodoxin family protein [Thermodesulfobacteriota bacterium]
MLVTGIIGSPRKGGNTDLMVQKILEGASSKGSDTRTVYLNNLNIKGCQACMQCKTNEFRCAVEDDMQTLYPLIDSSDVLVLGSPIYIGYITGIMKTFIDRWYAYSRVPEEKKLQPGKRIFLVFPYAREEEDLFNHVAKQVGQSFKFVFGAKVDSLMVPGVRAAGAVLKQEELLNNGFDIGVGFVTKG